jgi:signal transduction histidine kinase
MIEDTRIARKLHDALLQNFQAMMFRFQAARNLMMRHPDEALRSLNDAINEGEKALDESRDAIQDLGSEREGDLAELSPTKPLVTICGRKSLKAEK